LDTLSFEKSIAASCRPLMLRRLPRVSAVGCF
jgi:hypothetical protein